MLLNFTSFFPKGHFAHLDRDPIAHQLIGFLYLMSFLFCAGAPSIFPATAGAVGLAAFYNPRLARMIPWDVILKKRILWMGLLAIVAATMVVGPLSSPASAFLQGTETYINGIFTDVTDIVKMAFAALRVVIIGAFVVWGIGVFNAIQSSQGVVQSITGPILAVVIVGGIELFARFVTGGAAGDGDPDADT